MLKRMVIYRLRQLQELGWTEEQLARALKITEDSVRRLKAGKAEISSTTELELGKVLSNYVRRKLIESGVVPPRIVHENAPPSPPVSAAPSTAERGVYVEEIAPPGETWYKVVLSTGKVGIVHFPDELVDPGLYENLCRRLERKDSLQTLKAI
ncbi:MAG: hypothetical protein JWL97_2986 [Gemmatimonadales bacterium]|nr:hypothetical protein [Gemmatimonadales bacterium]